MPCKLEGEMKPSPKMNYIGQMKILLHSPINLDSGKSNTNRVMGLIHSIPSSTRSCTLQFIVICLASTVIYTAVHCSMSGQHGDLYGSAL
jgi:hypothetical protein